MKKTFQIIGIFISGVLFVAIAMMLTGYLSNPFRSDADVVTTNYKQAVDSILQQSSQWNLDKDFKTAVDYVTVRKDNIQDEYTYNTCLDYAYKQSIDKLRNAFLTQYRKPNCSHKTVQDLHKDLSFIKNNGADRSDYEDIETLYNKYTEYHTFAQKTFALAPQYCAIKGQRSFKKFTEHYEQSIHNAENLNKNLSNYEFRNVTYIIEGINIDNVKNKLESEKSKYQEELKKSILNDMSNGIEESEFYVIEKMINLAEAEGVYGLWDEYRTIVSRREEMNN